MRKLSSVVLTFNEEAKVETALSSLTEISDEIVIVDSFSTDRTVELGRRYTDDIHLQPWQGYRKQKQFATDQATHDWVLSLDADEELSREFRAEILKWKSEREIPYNGYLIPRLTHFMGRWIKHTTWYPDWQLRLFRKSKGSWEGRRVHESFRV